MKYKIIIGSAGTRLFYLYDLGEVLLRLRVLTTSLNYSMVTMLLDSFPQRNRRVPKKE